ncbi:hypothetical protein ABIF78_001307 [Bradyrhizobium japonicum]
MAATLMPLGRTAEAEPSPALEGRSGTAEARTDAAQREIVARGHSCRVTEIAIGREATPGLVTAVEQVEHDGARHDRDHCLANPEAAALFGKPGLDAAAGLDAKGGAAGQRNRIDALDRAGKVEQRILARAGPAAAHVDRRDRRGIEDDRRRAGGDFRILGMADADAGDIGKQIFQGRHSMRFRHQR